MSQSPKQMRAYQLVMETKSNDSRRSSHYHRSVRSSTSSGISARVQALADAAAASQNAAFEETIAKRTAYLRVQQMTNETSRKIEEMKREVEQQRKLVNAEADIQVLRARQAAAVEKARTEAILKAEDGGLDVHYTSPSQTSNDHASLFRNLVDPSEFSPNQSYNDHVLQSRTIIDAKTQPAGMSELRPSAPTFEPVDKRPSPLQGGVDVTELIHHDVYVDDGLTSQADARAAISLIERSRDALSSKKLRFHKIASNSKEVMEAFPQDERSKDLKCLDLCRDQLPTQRSLGVYWSLESDTFTFQVNLQDKPFSRGVLSVASSIYDPLGLAAPITLKGKVILRELMAVMKEEQKSPKDLWDRPLPEKHLPR